MDSTSQPPPLSRTDSLELDLDVRLHSLMTWALSQATPNAAVLAGFLRMAYVAGYQDALSEPSRGQLHRDHGYRIPPKRRFASS